jgi:coatomer protein complex subunit gamma
LENPSDQPFDIYSVSTKPKNLLAIDIKGAKPSLEVTSQEKKARITPRATNYAQQLLSIPQLANLGELLNSTPPQYLTESDMVSSPYHVKVIKHIFPRHIVLQYPVTNTLQEQVLRNLTLEMGTNEDNGYTIQTIIPALEAVYNEPSDIYAIIKRPPVKSTDKEFKFPAANLWNNLRFYIHDIDAKTNQVNNEGFPDEFQLDEVEIKIADFMRRQSVPNFSTLWAQTDNSDQYSSIVSTFSLSTVPSLKDGVNEMIKVLGMIPCENSQQVADNATKHVLFLSGQFVELGGIPVLARVRMRFSPQQGAGMELTVRSTNKFLSEALANIFFT